MKTADGRKMNPNSVANGWDRKGLFRFYVTLFDDKGRQVEVEHIEMNIRCKLADGNTVVHMGDVAARFRGLRDNGDHDKYNYGILIECVATGQKRFVYPRSITLI